jgi:hypothetical protein
MDRTTITGLSEGLPGQDCHYRTIRRATRTGLPERTTRKDCQKRLPERTARTGETEHNCWERTAKTILTGEGCQDNTVGIGLANRAIMSNCNVWTVKRGQLGQESQKRAARQDGTVRNVE